MLKPNINQQNDSKTIVKQILKASENIFQVMGITIPPEWLMTDMTVAQLRVLLLLHTEGPSRMSSIAGTLGIAVSTATGIIDNLVKKNWFPQRGRRRPPGGHLRIITKRARSN